METPYIWRQPAILMTSTLKNMWNVLLVRDRVMWHPDNTDTMACPLGVRINRVPLYMNFTEVIFRPIKRLELVGSWFPESSADFYSVLSKEDNRTSCCLDVSPLQHYSALFALRQQQQQHKLYLHDYNHVVTVLQKL